MLGKRSKDNSGDKDMAAWKEDLDSELAEKKPPASNSSKKLTNITSGTGIISILALSFAVNILFLTGPIFMLQVYDRVLASGNIATLLGLVAIAMLLYLAFGLFDALRQKIAMYRGEEIALRYDGPAFSAAIEASASGTLDARATAPEDVDTVRNFITSPGILTFFDFPSIPLYFLAVLVLHPLLGVVVVVACILLAIVAVINDRQSQKQMRNVQQSLSSGSRILNDARRNAVTLHANGMVGATQEYWQSQQQAGRAGILGSLNVVSTYGTVTKTLRLAIQSLVLAVGAWLAVKGELSPGAMIAASTVFARSIAPIEQLLGNFRNLTKARESWSRIQEWAPDYVDVPEETFQLPAPVNNFSAEQVRVNAPNTGASLIQNVSFKLEAGDILVVIGSSGAGKSSLSRALIGAWPIAAGDLRIDGAQLSQWPAARLGQHVGYLSQYIELVEGDIAQNIARFQPNATSEAVLKATQAANAHELILSFPDGYQTKIGNGAMQLSGGQKQRVGLARAIYGDPFVVILDEPSAHLDPEGKQALIQTLAQRKMDKKITILTSHDEHLLKIATKVMVLGNGQMLMSGPRDDVLAKLHETNSQKEVA